MARSFSDSRCSIDAFERHGKRTRLTLSESEIFDYMKYCVPQDEHQLHEEDTTDSDNY